MTKLGGWLATPQKRLGPAGLITLLVLASLITPLSLDMYTPAVPHMAEQFDTTQGLVNLTLVGFFLFFAVAALFTAAGPFIWMLASKFTTVARFTTLLLGSSLAAGVAMLLFGTTSPVVFCVIFLFFALGEATIRPYSTNILLSQNDGDAGAASSVINFTHTAVGSIGMLAATLPWPNYVVGIGALIVIAMSIAGIGWFTLMKSSIPLKGVKEGFAVEKRTIACKRRTRTTADQTGK